MKNYYLKLEIVELWLTCWNNKMTSNQFLTQQKKNIFNFLSNGNKVALYQNAPFLDAELYPDVEQKPYASVSSTDKKYDVVMVNDLKNISELQYCLNMTPENGVTVVLIENKTIKEKLRIAYFLCMLLLKSKKNPLKIKGYFVLPVFSVATQLISSHRYLAQQYFHKYYHWQYNAEAKKTKRILKHLIYLFNAFYLTENYFLFWISKNAK